MLVSFLKHIYRRSSSPKQHWGRLWVCPCAEKGTPTHRHRRRNRHTRAHTHAQPTPHNPSRPRVWTPRRQCVAQNSEDGEVSRSRLRRRVVSKGNPQNERLSCGLPGKASGTLQKVMYCISLFDRQGMTPTSSRNPTTCPPPQ